MTTAWWQMLGYSCHPPCPCILDCPQLVDRHLDLGDGLGRANTGDKMMTLVASAPRPGGRDPGTGGRPSPPRRDRECHPRPQVRRGAQPSPLGPFPANGAWLAVQVIAHNLARWTARIGLGEQLVTTKTLRRRFFSLAGRLTRSARRLTLHLPQGWPWENQFSRALARFRALPLPS